MQVFVFEAHIVLRRIGEEFDFPRRQLALATRWIADIQTAARQPLTLRDDAPRADHHEILDVHGIQQYSAHADQHCVTDSAGMQYRAMAYRHVRTHLQRTTARHELTVVRDMQHTAVLYAGTCADRDVVHVPANNRSGPYRDIVAKSDAADHDSGVVDEDALTKLRLDAAIRVDGHEKLHLREGPAV